MEDLVEKSGGTIYSEPDLKPLSVAVIKGLLKKIGQKTSGTKPDLIARVLAWQNIPENEVRKTLQDFKESATKGESPIHVFYRDHFNPVDLADGYYYSTCGAHHFKNWRPKFVMVLFLLGLVNVHAIVKCAKPNATMNNTAKNFAKRVLSDTFTW